jgi:hypothetical protein
VLAVEPRGLADGDDEELRAVRVRPGVGHGQRPAHDLVVVDLVLERVARAAGAGARRVAALDHEVADDPVEDHAVVEALAGELLEVGDGLRRVLVESSIAIGPSEVRMVAVEGKLRGLSQSNSWISGMATFVSAGCAVTHSTTWRNLPETSSSSLMPTSFFVPRFSQRASRMSGGSLRRGCRRPRP